MAIPIDPNIFPGDMKSKFLTMLVDKLVFWKKSVQLEEADAVILEVSKTGMVRRGLTETRLLLQVSPKHGRNYIAEYQKYFSDESLYTLRSGVRTKIYFRANEPLKVRWLKSVLS